MKISSLKSFPWASAILLVLCTLLCIVTVTNSERDGNKIGDPGNNARRSARIRSSKGAERRDIVLAGKGREKEKQGEDGDFGLKMGVAKEKKKEGSKAISAEDKNKKSIGRKDRRRQIRRRGSAGDGVEGKKDVAGKKEVAAAPASARNTSKESNSRKILRQRMLRRRTRNNNNNKAWADSSQRIESR